MNLEVIENRLLGLDDEIHHILQYIHNQKGSDIGNDITSDIEDYENLPPAPYAENDADIMKNLQIDFTPENIKEFKDTGYELKKKYLQKGYKGKLGGL